MKEVPLFKTDRSKDLSDECSLVDDHNYDKVIQSRWWIIIGKRMTKEDVKYARGWVLCDGKWKCQLMHRFIMRASDGDPSIDHRNRNGIDNQESNLRPCTHGTNAYNTDARSGYRCVSWISTKGVWVVAMVVAGRCIYGGSYNHETEAALAADALAREYHGEFANLNFPHLKGIMPIVETRDERVPRRILECIRSTNEE